MDWLALLFDVRGTHQLRSVFEEGVLARQLIRRWLSVADSNLFRGLALFVWRPDG
jgi:hypothetical protein